MSVSARYQSVITATETLATNVPAISPGDNAITLNGFDTSLSLTSSSTPAAITKDAYFTATLTTGALTIDLTALTGTQGAVTFNGLKVQVAKFKAPATNTANIVVTKGASNGYGMGTGGVTFTWVIPPGAEITFYSAAIAAAVAGGAKTWDVTGTGSETCSVGLLAG